MEDLRFSNSIQKVKWVPSSINVSLSLASASLYTRKILMASVNVIALLALLVALQPPATTSDYLAPALAPALGMFLAIFVDF